MLRTLTIKNLALVESLTWDLGKGLVCVTGETGAGKSIIVGALKLVLGERADRDLIRTGEDTCTVEAVFEPGDLSAIDTSLAEAGFDPCEGGQLIIKRVISTSGANRQFVNCASATLAVLRSIGQHLVDLHGPHEHQSLSSQERQLAMLDAAASAEKAIVAYTHAWQQWRLLAQELDDLTKAGQATDTELELLRYQVTEIEAAALKPDEEEPLHERHKLATNSSKLVTLSSAALGLLCEADDCILNKLRELRSALRDMERTDTGAARVTSGFESAVVELEDLESGLRDYQDSLEVDPREAQELEERINLIESLKRKYGGSVARVISHGESAQSRLSKVESRSEELERLGKAVTNAKATLVAAGTTLSQARKKAAPRLAKEVMRHLADLGFRQALFSLDLIAHKLPAATGMEQVDFMFAPNPGEPARPLRIIASSGEMSRVMLAVKSALAKEDAIPLLVFDEIDANVGGEIAAAVGRKMQELGESHQIISITHMPQVAALAGSHYVVTKTVSEGRTHSGLVPVSGETRVDEITRMLGGKAASARAHAKSLLAGNQ